MYSNNMSGLASSAFLGDSSPYGAQDWEGRWRQQQQQKWTPTANNFSPVQSPGPQLPSGSSDSNSTFGNLRGILQRVGDSLGRIGGGTPALTSEQLLGGPTSEAMQKYENKLQFDKFSKAGLDGEGNPIQLGLAGKVGNFFNSDLAAGLGKGIMGAAQLGLAYKGYKENRKMNKELLKDMRTNRANLQADRQRAADQRKEFSHMMNTL